MNSHLVEMHPNKGNTANKISNISAFLTLNSFNSSQLLCLAVKFLKLTEEAAHVLDNPHIVLNHFVGHTIVRRLGRKHNRKNIHPMFSRKALNLDDLAL